MGPRGPRAPRPGRRARRRHRPGARAHRMARHRLQGRVCAGPAVGAACADHIIAPRVPAQQVPGGRAFGYPKQLDRARCILKPTSRPISKCCHSRANPFLERMQCNCSAAELAVRAMLLWVRIELRAFAFTPPRLASPSRRERGECRAAKGHRSEATTRRLRSSRGS